MATTAEGTRLTAWHQDSQLVIRAGVLRSLLSLWPAFAITDMAATWPAVQTALMLLTEQGRTRSAAIARTYYQSYRAAERLRGATPPDPVLLPWEAGARISYDVTGPVAAAQALKAGRSRTEASDIAFVRLAGSVSRMVLNAGRETVTQMVGADPALIGWIRVTTEKPCAFCAMLATRGAVYRQAGAGFRAHDHCACTAEPVARNDHAAWPERNRQLLQTWNDATRGLTGSEARRAFRRAIEAP